LVNFKADVFIQAVIKVVAVTQLSLRHRWAEAADKLKLELMLWRLLNVKDDQSPEDEGRFYTTRRITNQSHKSWKEDLDLR
jgi:hypothetical protein